MRTSAMILSGAAGLLCLSGALAQTPPVNSQAQAAKKRHIPIYTVTLGTDHGTVDGKSVRSDPSTLAQIARASGGHAYTAQDAGQLARVYKQLAVKVAKEKRPVEVTELFAGGALLLMALSALSSLGLRGRLI